MANPKVAWISSQGYLTVIIDGVPRSVKNDTRRAKKIRKLLQEKKFDEVKSFFGTLEERIEQFTKKEIKVREDLVYDSEGVQMPEVIAKKLTEFASQGLPYKPLKNFWENLKQNPSENSRNALYSFLEVNSFPITEDGCFLAYKKVYRNENGKLVDDKTKTISNEIGEIVSVPRDKVDPDNENTCSFGLHVAAWEYAQNYSGNVLVEVKVNPADVVAVPRDYNNQKMRVCRYEVIKVGGEQVRESYLGNYRSASGETPIEKMTAKQIKEFVKNKTGYTILVSERNKKGILRKALDFLGLSKAEA